jgi:CRISPR-associated protein Cas2
MHYLICYDITDDKRRNYMARFLLDYGQRVQYSVFECRLTEKSLDIILQGVVNYIKPEEDSVRIYRLCAECSSLVKSFGLQRLKEPVSVIVV